MTYSRRLVQNNGFAAKWTHGMLNVNIIVFILCIMMIFLMCGVASAAYSDHYSRKSSAAGSAYRTLKYGGTYSQAGQNYINNRDNWSTTGQVRRKTPATAREKAQSHQLIRKTNNMIKSIYGNPHNFGPSPQGARWKQKRQMYQTIKKSNDLIRRINNDPLLK
ncbi:hypothetical protein [Desulfosarcina variabilis]|uniref:hypothetical protein n=1 Tax=Desulfosarcina variabilis TaxID=2300 RepID=UPI003AFAAEC2